MYKELMKTNCYDVDKKMIIVGSCVKQMFPKTHNKLENMSDNIFHVCLEEIHLNMVITKIMGMLSRVNVEELIFVTVDKSPHCIQMHYIENEIQKAMDLSGIKITHYVVVKDELVEISKETISKSKNLFELENNKE